MNNFKKTNFFLVVILLVSVQIEAIEYGIPDVQYFNRRQYQAGTQNWEISQSEAGMLYFANNEGVIEYDGTSWRRLPNVVNSIYRAVLAHKGRVYIGADGEFGYYEARSVMDMEYHSLTEKYDIDDTGDFWEIFAVGEQIIFQSEKALCIYTPNEGVEVVPARSRISKASWVNEMLLVQDEVEGLMELRQGKLFKVPGGDFFAGISLGTILPLSNEEVLIATTYKGLYKWGVDGIKKWEPPAGKFLADANVYCGTIHGNDLVFGTIQSGMVITDNIGHIKMVLGKDHGLKNNTVLSVFVDQQKNIWAGLDNGIAWVEYNSAISFIQGYFDLGTGYCMEEKNNLVFLGTNQGLYSIGKDEFANPIKDRKDFTRLPGTDGQVWSLFEDKTSGILLCGHDLGIFRIQGHSSTRITPSSVRGAWVFRPVPGFADRLVVGSYKGLLLLKLNSHREWEFVREISGFSESSRFIEWGQDGALWMVHGLKGIYKLYFDDALSTVTRVLSNHDFSGLENFQGFSLSKVFNRLIFTSSQGIYSLKEENGLDLVHDKLESYFVNDESFPTKIKQDRFGNVWFFIDNGVGVLRKQEDGSYKRIDHPLMPLKSKLVNGFESFYVKDTKTTFFGVEDGFGVYSLGKDINYFKPYNVHIRTFSSQKPRKDSFSKHSGTEESQKNVPTFSFSQNSFDVFFSATSYGSGRNEYSTWLEGFDEEWSPWSFSQNKQFTRIPEGDYAFNVKARNSHGVESTSAVFRFRVFPPWFRSRTAQTIYVFLILGLVIGLWLLSKRIIKKNRLREKLKQQEKFKSREEQLKNEALIVEKEMIRLRNEKLRNDVVVKEKELTNSSMQIIHKNEFLIKMKGDLQTLKKAGDINTMNKKIASLVRQIDRDIDNESQWQIFETHLGQVHEEFLKRLADKHNDLTSRELKLAAYLRMEMSSKEIATLMNISPRAVENNRYQLRKKLQLNQGENLVEYIMKI